LLLSYFVENPGRVVDKEELIAGIWPNITVSNDSLSQCLKDIRAALGDDAERLVRTIPRRGYMLDEDLLVGDRHVDKYRPSGQLSISQKS
jgi:adenylate cyclase